MKSRFVVNFTANMLSFVIAILISIWLVPFLINSLGAEAYGFVPLTQQLINYMEILTLMVNGMIIRFFTIAVKSDNLGDAEEYFNTSFYSTLVVSVLIVIPFFILVIFINKIVNVPDYLLWDVQICIIFFSLTFILNAIGSSFSMAAFCENRLDINCAFNIVYTLVRTVLIIVFFHVFTPQIWLVGAGTLIASLISFIMKIYFFHKLMPDVHINRAKFCFIKLKELVASSIWDSINQIGTLFFLQVDMLVPNWSLGARIAGEYAAVVQWSFLLRAFVGNITSVFAPTIMLLYARKEMNKLVDYTNYSIKITGLFMALPVGIICALGGDILNLWLGKEFIKYGLLLALLTFHLPINLAVQSLFSVFTAMNRIKIPAVANMIMGSLNLVLALLFTYKLNLGPIGIALAGAIALTAKNLLFTPVYSAIITRQHWSTYYKGILKPLAAFSLIVMFILLLRLIIRVDHWSDLFLLASIIVIAYVILSYTVFLNKTDKEDIKARFGYLLGRR